MTALRFGEFISAAGDGNTATMDELVSKHKVNVHDVQPDSLWNAAHEAASKGSIKSLNWLCERASPELFLASNKFGWNACHWAARLSKVEVLAWFANHPKYPQFKQALTQKNANGDTPLDTARQYHKKESVQFLENFMIENGLMAKLSVVAGSTEMDNNMEKTTSASTATTSHLKKSVRPRIGGGSAASSSSSISAKSGGKIVATASWSSSSSSSKQQSSQQPATTTPTKWLIDLFAKHNIATTSIPPQDILNKFTENGVADAETFCMMDKNDLQQMGIPLGNRLQLFSLIEKEKQQQQSTITTNVDGKNTNTTTTAAMDAETQALFDRLRNEEFPSHSGVPIFRHEDIKYDFESGLLGTGAFGIVVAAVILPLRCKCAAKISEHIDNAIQEAKNCIGLRNINVVGLLGVAVVPGGEHRPPRIAILLEKADFDLRKLLNLNKNRIAVLKQQAVFENGNEEESVSSFSLFSLKKIYVFMFQIAFGLFYLHTEDPSLGKKRILHLDLKPENVLVYINNSSSVGGGDSNGSIMMFSSACSASSASTLTYLASSSNINLLALKLSDFGSMKETNTTETTLTPVTLGYCPPEFFVARSLMAAKYQENRLRLQKSSSSSSSDSQQTSSLSPPTSAAAKQQQQLQQKLSGSARYDVFAFGVILHEMICSQQPSCDKVALGQLLVNEIISTTSTTTKTSEIPESLADVDLLKQFLPTNSALIQLCVECLMVDPEKRIHNGRELYRRMIECCKVDVPELVPSVPEGRDEIIRDSGNKNSNNANDDDDDLKTVPSFKTEKIDFFDDGDLT
jgi:serine/threonine protein kinase